MYMYVPQKKLCILKIITPAKACESFKENVTVSFHYKNCVPCCDIPYSFPPIFFSKGKWFGICLQCAKN